MFLHLLALEAKYGAPSQYTAAIEQIIEHYKKVCVQRYLIVVRRYAWYTQLGAKFKQARRCFHQKDIILVFCC